MRFNRPELGVESFTRRKTPARLPITIATIAVAIAFGSFPVQAQAVRRTPLPEFTGARVTVSEVPDNYQYVTKAVAATERSTGAFFYFVVIRSSGSGQDATRKYVDDLFQAWSARPKGRSGRFDPERSVVVVVSLDNRQIGTHAGSLIRERYGLDGAAIRSEIVVPRFIPHARDGDFTKAMIALLEGFDEKIASTRAGSTTTTVRERDVLESLPTDGKSITLPRTATASRGSTSRTFLWALLASVAAIVAIVAGLLWLGRRRVSESVSTQLKSVKGQAVEAMDRLDALKERLKLLPAAAGFDLPVTGETLALREAVQAKLDSLWDRWLQIMEKIDKAQKLLQNSGGFGLGNRDSRQAEEILKKEIQFPEIDAEAKACEAELERLEKAHVQAKAVLNAFTEARKKLKTQLEEVAKAGLPTSGFDQDVDEIQNLSTQADSLQSTDPIGAAEVVAKASAHLEGQIGRARSILSLLAQSKTIERALKETENATASQRAKGLSLQEEGGNPDAPLAEGKKHREIGMTALQSGDPVTAQRELGEAEAQAKRAQQVLDAVVQAKAACRREGPARERETARLRDALTEAKNYRDELQRDFAPSSWDGVARNLDQAKALLDTFDRKAAEAADQGSDAKQNYLLGAKLYEELGRQQQIALRLMAGLGEQVNTLAAIRKECQDLKRQLEAADRKVETLLQQNSEIISDQTQSAFESARRTFAESQEKADDRRPDWPAIREELTRILEEYAIVETHAQGDLTAYQALVSELEIVRKEADRIEAFLSSHTEDRPAANRRFQSASQTLGRIGDGRDPGQDWAQLLQLVRDASSDLQAAERMAKEDIRLAAQAESDIAEADSMIRQASTALGFGIHADTSDSVARLRQAQQFLRAQNYEQAITQAEGAFQSARSSYNAAAQQVYYQQMQYDAEQRRQYAAEMARAAYRGPSAGSIAAATAAATILSRMAEGSGWGPGRVSAGEDFQRLSSDSAGNGADPSANEGPDDGTSVSSWSSDSTQSGW